MVPTEKGWFSRGRGALSQIGGPDLLSPDPGSVRAMRKTHSLERQVLLIDSSSVHTQETNQNQPPTPSYRTHLASLHPEEFQLAAETIFYLFPDETDSTRQSFQNCRADAWFVRRKSTGEVRVHSRHCRNRFCPFCSQSKAAVISHNVFDWVKTLDRPKLLTLTLKHSAAPLDQQLTHLYDHFRTWRNRAPMKKEIKGGIWFVQVTLNPDDYTWHPHLHVILDASWIHQKVLSDAWLKVTKTSQVLDIREIRSAEKAAGYVARYVARAGDLRTMPVDYRAELYHALGRRRSCGAFGSARKAKVMDRPVYDRSDWENIGSFSLVVSLFHTVPEAREIYMAWRQNQPLLPGITLLATQHALDWDTGDLHDSRSPPAENQPNLWGAHATCIHG